jgi:glycosyltransferase involved in cell wall biosynthesis
MFELQLYQTKIPQAPTTTKKISMVILEINTEKNWRGGEKQTLLTAEGLIHQGHTIELACKNDSILFQKACSKNISTRAIHSNIQLFLFLLFNGSKYDIIHVHTSKALTPCVLSKPFHSAKIIFSRRHYKTPSSFFSKWKYNSADYITTISQYIKNRLVNAGIKKPIDVIYDASILIPVNGSRIEKEYDIYTQTNKKILATVAALEDEKDPYTLVEAIAKLHATRTDFIFLHFGSGSLQDEIKQLVVEKKLESVYFFMGQTPSIEELYTLFDVFIMASKNEGFGSSVIDAFLNKVPVVSTDAGGLKELVSTRGYIAKTENATDLFEQIQACLTHSNETFIANALDFATTQLSTEYIQQQYAKLFLKLTQPTVYPTQGKIGI